MENDIKDFVKSCTACQYTGSHHFKEPLHPIKVRQLFDRIIIDFIGNEEEESVYYYSNRLSYEMT